MKHPASYIIIILISLSSCELDTYKQGERLYGVHCESCHMKDGSGLAKLIPPLESDYYKNNRDQLSCIIRYGLKDSILVNDEWYEQEMPRNKDLSEIEIVNIINYMDNVLLKDERFTTLKDVKAQLENCDN